MPASSDPTSEFLAYLDVLMESADNDSFVEMRSRLRDMGTVAQFFARAETDRLARAVADRAHVTDVYIGCAPRSCRRGDKQGDLRGVDPLG